MNETQLWKNFSLVKELNISGSLIYNGLEALHSLEGYSREDIVFEFLYNISIGIERLQKIIIVLIEYDDNIDNEEFEKSLITHNHLELQSRINQSYDCKYSNIHNEFLNILNDFYRSMRYDRFTLNSVKNQTKEKDKLISFIEKHLKVKVNHGLPFECVCEERHKKFLSKIVGRICKELYKIVREESTKQNIFTYELRHNSKAQVIFLREQYDFYNSEIVMKELLVYLINSNEESDFLDLIKEIEPLNLDFGMVNSYIASFKSKLNTYKYIDEIKMLYEDLEDINERLEILDLLGDENVYSIENQFVKFK